MEDSTNHQRFHISLDLIFLNVYIIAVLLSSLNFLTRYTIRPEGGAAQLEAHAAWTQQSFSNLSKNSE